MILVYMLLLRVQSRFRSCSRTLNMLHFKQMYIQ